MKSPILRAAAAPFVTILIFSNTAHPRIDDPAYHHLDEIYAEIFALQEEYPDRVIIDSIGSSQQERLPIYDVWIVDAIEDTSLVLPSVVFVGQLHAEEVLGVEYCMWLLQKMMTREARQWRRNVHTHIIPTCNPEGLRAVYDIDYFFRKNKRDNIGDGYFRFKPGWGGDTSGVDLNRNWLMFWANGDAFLSPRGTEKYDYYRGPAPMSESETQALDRLFDRIRPLYSIVLHSSRTGLFAEKILYPWEFGQGDAIKQTPDRDSFNSLGYEVARRCKKIGTSSTYENVLIATPQGDSEVYFYWRYGTLAMRAEIGQKGEAMQPDSADIYRIINDIHPGMSYLLNSAAGVPSDERGPIVGSRLDILVADPARNPLEARLVMPTRTSPLIPYRATNPATGAYYWMVRDGFSDTLTVSKYGYKTWRRRVFGGIDPSLVRVTLEPLPWHDIEAALFDDSGNPINQPVELSISHADTAWTTSIYDGRVSLRLASGEHTLALFGGAAFMPRRDVVLIDTSRTWNFTLNQASAVFDQGFDGGDVVFASDNQMNLNGLDSLARWELTDDIYHSPPRSLTDSRRGRTIKLEDGWCAPYNLLDRSFDLSAAQSAALVYWINQALEPGYDSVWVEVSTGGAADSSPDEWDWAQVAPAHQDMSILDPDKMKDYILRPWNSNPRNLQQFAEWKQFVVPLGKYAGESNFHFCFRIRSDVTIEEDGVYIDDVQLLASGAAPVAPAAVAPVPERFMMDQAYPNPFNSILNVRFNIPRAGDLHIRVYDILGRPAWELPARQVAAGAHVASIDAAGLPSGIYLLRAGFEGATAVEKIIMLK